MIIKELFKTRKDGVNLYKSYSDENVKLKQVETGVLYDSPIDVEEANFTYEETDVPIEEVYVDFSKLNNDKTVRTS
jgi:hypothetical protein